MAKPADNKHILLKQSIVGCLFCLYRGWSGGAKVLGNLPVPGRPTNLDYSRARAYCACSRCGWGLCGHFTLIYPYSFLSPSLWETARYRLKYCLKGPLSPKQPTNQSVFISFILHFISYFRLFGEEKRTTT